MGEESKQEEGARSKINPSRLSLVSLLPFVRPHFLKVPSLPWSPRSCPATLFNMAMGWGSLLTQLQHIVNALGSGQSVNHQTVRVLSYPISTIAFRIEWTDTHELLCFL
nr:unnamed protein product [Mus musculus]